MSATMTQEQSTTVDVEQLRRRYEAERAKRVRSDGIRQYVAAEGEFASFVEDPYAVQDFARTALDLELECLVIGGGFSGLISSAKLTAAGITDFRIIERAGDFGGTWYWNRYPGVRCDVESYIYLPLLEETGYMPTEKYATGEEIRQHARRIGTTFGLYDKALFQTQVVDMRWHDASERWLVKTDRGDTIRARYVLMSNGPHSRPKLPGIPGIETFKGKIFHTARWDFDYTGGDVTGGLTGLGDKVVGIIGTGATAIQVVPHLAAAAKALYVFQRTPSTVDERNNSPTDPEWFNGLQPGWQRDRSINFARIISGAKADVDMVDDGWTRTAKDVGALFFGDDQGEVSLEEIGARLENADARKMEQLRGRIDRVVKNKATADALKPWYRLYCKRPGFSDEYLDAFNHDTVSLIDTQGRGVERITETGVVVAGTEYPLDCLIFATGFEVGTAYTRRSGYDVIGRDGLKLSDHWATGLKSFHGFYTNGFPNYFHLGITQSGMSFNFTATLVDQSEHLVRLLQHAKSVGATYIEPTEEAERTWVTTIREKAAGNQAFHENCTPGYYNNEGKPGEGVGVIAETYGGGPIEFNALLEKWWEEGRFGLTIR